MTSKAEQHLSRYLRAVLMNRPVGASIPDCELSNEALRGLEHFLSEVLGEIYPEWQSESLDTIYPTMSRKTSEWEVEIFGLCIIVSDQTLAPLHVCLQIAPANNEVSWLECRLGKRGKDGMVRTPYEFLSKMRTRLYLLDGNADQIDWAYKATFGERRRR